MDIDYCLEFGGFNYDRMRLRSFRNIIFELKTEISECGKIRCSDTEEFVALQIYQVDKP